MKKLERSWKMAMSFNEDIKGEIKALDIKHYELAYAVLLQSFKSTIK